MEDIHGWGKAYDEWENSPEGVHYNLIMDCDSTAMEALIVETTMRLSEEIREYVYKECFIISLGESFTGTVYPPTSERWYVVLNEYQILDKSNNDAMSIIAHEIAHAWLKHDKFSPNINGKAVEIEAASLTAAWGFAGIGSDIEFVTRHFSRQARG